MFIYISPEANIVDTRGTPTPTIQKEPSKNKTQTSLKGQNGTISPASQGLSSRCACMTEIPVFLDLKQFMKTTEKSTEKFQVTSVWMRRQSLKFLLISNYFQTLLYKATTLRRPSIKKKKVILAREDTRKICTILRLKFNLSMFLLF